MEFSRHLCNVKRSTTLKRGWCSRAKSDSAILGSDDGHKYSAQNKCSSWEREAREESFQNFSMLGNFLDKKKNLSSRFDGTSPLKDLHDCASLEPPSHLEKTTENVWTTSLFREVTEDDSASFCASVSSLAFSDFTNVAEGKPRNIVDYDLHEKNSKFRTIETWLQQLASPNVKADFRKIRKN